MPRPRRTLLWRSCASRPAPRTSSTRWPRSTTTRGWCGARSVAIAPDPACSSHSKTFPPQPLLEARGWLPAAAPATGWRRLYLHLRGRLCRDCRAPSDYVFPLLSDSYRLCERCEAAGPRYALLTAAQAVEGFGLSAEQLRALPCREVRGLRSRAVEKRLRVLGQATLYLRSAVAQLAEQAQRAGADGDAPQDSDDDDDDDDEDAEEAPQFALDDDGGGEGAPRRRAPAQSADEVRTARKANKAAVKAANRERRQSKAAQAEKAEPRRTYAAMSMPMSRSPGAALPPRSGSSPGTPTTAFRAGSSPRTRTPGRHAREAQRSLAAGTSPNSGGPLARAWLEDELGQFGISGLERAD